MKQFERTTRLLGGEAVSKLREKRVAVFGIGGVGGYTVEALARSGVGHFLLVDADTVSESNINRQIIADYTTLGREKTLVMKERILRIHPEAQVETRECFYLPERSTEYDFAAFDYVVDAVDTVTAKVDLIVRCKEVGTPVISCMGAGNKLNPTAFLVTDIYQTHTCPLAKVMRKELKARGVDGCKVVYSTEPPGKPKLSEEERNERKQAPGSVAFVPSVAGLIAAGEVIMDLIGGYEIQK